MIWRSAAAFALALNFAFSAPAQPVTRATNAASTSTAKADASSDGTGEADWSNLSGEERRTRFRRANLSRFEPSGKGALDRLDHYSQTYGDINVYDQRLYLYKVKVTPVNGTTNTIHLAGEVSVGSFSTGLQSVLENLGFTVAENAIKVLPSADLGDTIYAVSVKPVATMRLEPRINSEQVNSIQQGGWVRLLRQATADDITSSSGGGRRSPRHTEEPGNDAPDQWYLAQTLEGYLGYVRDDEFHRTTEIRIPEGLVLTPSTAESADGPTTVPVGAYVYHTANVWRLMDGTKVPADVKIHDLRPKAKPEEIVKLMEPLIDTRYVWGGVTDLGIDCSGFSQFYLRTRGLDVPRDAEQQATGGTIVAWGADVEKLAQPGDLIFFANESGKISHVAVSLGNGEIIHSAGEGVHRAKLTDKRRGDGDERIIDRALLARRFTHN